MLPLLLLLLLFRVKLEKRLAFLCFIAIFIMYAVCITAKFNVIENSYVARNYSSDYVNDASHRIR